MVITEQGLKAWPIDPELLPGAPTAIASGKPRRALVLLKRYGKRYVPNKPVILLTAFALGDQEQYAPALAMLWADKGRRGYYRRSIT